MRFLSRLFRPAERPDRPLRCGAPDCQIVLAPERGIWIPSHREVFCSEEHVREWQDAMAW